MPSLPSGRRALRLAVGGLWLIAGALQLQSFMFTPDFAHDVFGNAALSQPGPLAAIAHTTERLVAAQPVAWNWVFALSELIIGAGLLLLRSGSLLRVACTASLAFGLGVWIVGEGMGGLFTGTAALSTGAPGAALLYSLLTMAAWPALSGVDRPLPHRRLRQVWSAVWVLGAVLVFVPLQWGSSGLSAQAAMGWMMAPHWAVGATLGVANWLAALPAFAAALICITMAVAHGAIGLAGWRFSYAERAFVVAGAVLALAYWMFAQGFGGITTGTATDVGTAPVLVVLAGAVLFSGAATTEDKTNAEPEKHAMVTAGQR